MYKNVTVKAGQLKRNKSVEGETIEQKIERIVNNKEPIKDGAPLIFTERKEGIKAAYNIRTDRWEVAIDAMDKVAKSYKARREESAKNRTPVKKSEGEGDDIGGAKSIHGKSDDTSK